MKNRSLSIIAGPCSVDDDNLHEIIQISQIEVKNTNGNHQRAIAGTRVVGLKSRTELDESGSGMGVDFHAYKNNIKILFEGGKISEMELMPSALMAEKINKKTGLMIATEVMSPLIQLPSFVGRLGKGMFLPWNPSVNQLGWQVDEIAIFARQNGWHIGLKNGKWLGAHLDIADHVDYAGRTTMEKTWEGLIKFAGSIDQDIILIHRGVDVPGKGDFRNALIHNISKRVKKDKHVKLFFDPSHTYGPKLRSQIVDATTNAMRMKMSDDEFLYDGVLIEVGNSKTDTEQHVTISELEGMVKNISKFRDLVAPIQQFNS